jgi:16S rRNA (cytidine1402-2'-O)-methyltransferase
LPATLYVIATPIGNLEDITLRALRVLRAEVALIACEDTRQTQKLLSYYEIRKPLVSYHEHNEVGRTKQILETLERGESVALVSDAGTPLISDPGYRVVHAAVEKGLSVVPIPGASAALAALAASGLPTDEFRFIGFLPPKSVARRKLLEGLAERSATIVAYESPHRLLESLGDIAQVLGPRDMVVARELTKVHEEFIRGSADTIRNELERRGAVKGEITLVIGKAGDRPPIQDVAAEVNRLQKELSLDRMEAIKIVARQQGLPKQEVYRRVAVPDSNPPDKRRD